MKWPGLVVAAITALFVPRACEARSAPTAAPVTAESITALATTLDGAIAAIPDAERVSPSLSTPRSTPLSTPTVSSLLASFDADTRRACHAASLALDRAFARRASLPPSQRTTLTHAIDHHILSITHALTAALDRRDHDRPFSRRLAALDQLEADEHHTTLAHLRALRALL
jgi:hypothetical protein